MPTRDVPFAPGTPSWVDLMTDDMDASKTFYTSLFGWVANEAPAEFGGYVNFASDGHNVAGLTKKPEGTPMPNVWGTYISSDDIAATATAIKDAGGNVMMGPDKVADLGSMAIASDPGGAVFGVWQAGTHIGFQKYNEAGSVTWDEFMSKDFPATVAFYERVFGWTMDKMADTDEFRYYTAMVNGEPVAGLMDGANFLPPQVPPHWGVYFSVEDTDEAAKKAADLGATIVRPADDTPYGRTADLIDNVGAVFKLHSTKMANPS